MKAAGGSCFAAMLEDSCIALVSIKCSLCLCSLLVLCIYNCQGWVNSEVLAAMSMYILFPQTLYYQGSNWWCWRVEPETKESGFYNLPNRILHMYNVNFFIRAGNLPLRRLIPLLWSAPLVCDNSNSGYYTSRWKLGWRRKTVLTIAPCSVPIIAPCTVQPIVPCYVHVGNYNNYIYTECIVMYNFRLHLYDAQGPTNLSKFESECWPQHSS